MNSNSLRERYPLLSRSRTSKSPESESTKRESSEKRRQNRINHKHFTFSFADPFFSSDKRTTHSAKEISSFWSWKSKQISFRWEMWVWEREKKISKKRYFLLHQINQRCAPKTRHLQSLWAPEKKNGENLKREVKACHQTLFWAMNCFRWMFPSGFCKRNSDITFKIKKRISILKPLQESLRKALVIVLGRTLWCALTRIERFCEASDEE